MNTDDSQPNKPIRKKKLNPAPGSPQPQPHPIKRAIKKRITKELTKLGLSDASIREAAREYLKRSWQPIPLLPREKRTIDKGWSHSHITEDDVDDRFDPKANIGVLMGTPSAGVVDVDLDWIRGLPYADEFFPPTPAIFGRASKPRSHRLYICDIKKTQRFEFAATVTKDDGDEDDKKQKSKPFVEIRADGSQTMFPPSVHPSSVRVRWDEDGTPATVDTDTLLQCARDYAAACLIGDLWPGEGARNEAALAVCGCLVKWGLPEERAKRIVRTAALIADDEEVEQRVAVCDSTKAKVEAGEHVVAEGVAKEIFSPRAVAKLRHWLGGKGAPDDPDSADEKKCKRSQADRVIELASDFDPFTTPGDEAEGWASVVIDGGRETFRLQSRACRHLLTSRYWNAYGKALGSTAVDSAVSVLQGRAVHEGLVEATAIRVAVHDGRIFVDIGDKQRHVIEISAGGWEIVRSCPVRFVRPQGQLPLPLPVKGGSLELIRPFVNVEDGDWVLLLSWIVCCFHPTGPYPILVLNGGQGSAKSTTTRVCKRLVDPSKAGLRSDPRNAQDLAVAAQNTWVLAFDNLSRISEGLSDSFCRTSTGGVFSTRLLYTNYEEALLEFKRPLIINGIPDLAVQPDLIDRCVHLVLPTLPKAARQLEDRFWAAFDVEHARMFGALLDAVSAMLRLLPAITIEDPPRMADFAIVGVAVETHLGLPPGTFLRAYEENRNAAAKLALAESGIVEPLRIILLGLGGRFHGTPSQLFDALQSSTNPAVIRARGSRKWPRSVNSFSGVLRRLSQSFDKVGLFYEDGRDNSHKRNRYIHLELTEPKHLVEKFKKLRGEALADQFPVKQVVYRGKPPLKKKYLPKKDPPPTQSDADTEEEG
jgi:hypothetical protein